MKRYLTAHDIANTARMTRALLNRATILIVEGDTDLRTYERFVSVTNCRVIAANGKETALGSVDILEKSAFKGVLAVVDTDYWELDGIKQSSPNIITTDTHDLETMILSSSALDKIVSEFGSSSKMARLCKPIRDVLLDAGIPLGYLRWISSPSKDNLQLKFQTINFYNFIHKNSLSASVASLVKEVKLNSGQNALDEKMMETQLDTLVQTRSHDPWHVCNGHDLVEILSIGLRRSFGKRKARQITSQVLDSMLRIAYEFSHFQSSRLHQQMKGWEQFNSPFRVFG